MYVNEQYNKVEKIVAQKYKIVYRYRILSNLLYMINYSKVYV